MIRLIIFDLWKTLGAIKTFSVTSAIKSTLNLDLEKEKVRKIYEEVYQTRVWNSKEESITELCKRFNISATGEIINKVSKILADSIANLEIYPHSIPLLKELKKRYKIGLISNTSKEPIRLIKGKTKLLEYIDYPLFSYETGCIKPNEEIFKKMLDLADCKPEETLMIGDSEIDDVTPAKNLGMNAILFKDYEQLKAELTTFGISIK